jgi:hypothetical protein
MSEPLAETDVERMRIHAYDLIARMRDSVRWSGLEPEKQEELTDLLYQVREALFNRNIDAEKALEDARALYLKYGLTPTT